MLEKNNLRILLIDDEKSIRDTLKLGLETYGYKVAEGADGKCGLGLAAEFHPHLIILDLGLPDMSGLDVLKRLRQWTTIPVIILTVTDDEPMKVQLLDAGADDYLTKPFGSNELMARIRVALRRHNSEEATPVFESGNLKVDLNKREVHVGASAVKLTSTEYALLTVLVRNRGRVVSQNQLLTEIWGEHSTEQTHYLRIYVGQLRKKLETDPSAPVHVLTDPGVGYRLT